MVLATGELPCGDEVVALPVDNLGPLANAGVPLLHAIGDADGDVSSPARASLVRCCIDSFEIMP